MHEVFEKYCQVRESAQSQYEDRKKDLKEILEALCIAWDQCVGELGANHPQCLALLLAKQDTESELNWVCAWLNE